MLDPLLIWIFGVALFVPLPHAPFLERVVVLHWNENLSLSTSGCGLQIHDMTLDVWALELLLRHTRTILVANVIPSKQ